LAAITQCLDDADGRIGTKDLVAASGVAAGAKVALRRRAVDAHVLDGAPPRIPYPMTPGVVGDGGALFVVGATGPACRTIGGFAFADVPNTATGDDSTGIVAKAWVIWMTSPGLLR
jgi:hypothetical protein